MTRNLHSTAGMAKRAELPPWFPRWVSQGSEPLSVMPMTMATPLRPKPATGPLSTSQNLRLRHHHEGVVLTGGFTQTANMPSSS